MKKHLNVVERSMRRWFTRVRSGDTVHWLDTCLNVPLCGDTGATAAVEVDEPITCQTCRLAYWSYLGRAKAIAEASVTDTVNPLEHDTLVAAGSDRTYKY